MVHSEEDYQTAVKASAILFGKSTLDELKSLDERTFLQVFEGVPKYEVDKEIIKNSIGIIDLLTEETKVFSSKGELRRLIKDNGLSINREKINNQELVIDSNSLLNEKYILVQKGKKIYFLIQIK
jgi:tyrosyl-tRNA synthetase